ncbi:MAG: hypothetical protein Q8R91_07490 [Candidatus Omnitrophota bacterium]|nr:hypothetical protein [Candidatus Omnitrophota bacterium]
MRRRAKGVETVNRSTGQSTAEYAIVLGVVLAALVAMQVYVKRGAQVKLKLGVDEFTRAGTTNRTWLPGDEMELEDGTKVSGDVTAGEVTLRSTTAQYEPYYAESSYEVGRTSTELETVNLADGTIRREITAETPEETKRRTDGYQKQRIAGEADVDLGDFEEVTP